MIKDDVMVDVDVLSSYMEPGRLTAVTADYADPLGQGGFRFSSMGTIDGSGVCQRQFPIHTTAIPASCPGAGCLSEQVGDSCSYLSDDDKDGCLKYLQLIIYNRVEYRQAPQGSGQVSGRIGHIKCSQIQTEAGYGKVKDEGSGSAHSNIGKRAIQKACILAGQKTEHACDYGKASQDNGQQK